MATKIRDIAVKTGTFKDAQGQEKGRWQNVGALMKDDQGGEFIILQRWFNPAGIANPDNRESVVLSCFKMDQNDSKPAQQNNRGASGGSGAGGQQMSPQQPPAGFDDWSDDRPF